MGEGRNTDQSVVLTENVGVKSTLLALDGFSPRGVG